MLISDAELFEYIEGKIVCKITSGLRSLEKSGYKVDISIKIGLCCRVVNHRWKLFDTRGSIRCNPLDFILNGIRSSSYGSLTDIGRLLFINAGYSSNLYYGMIKHVYSRDYCTIDSYGKSIYQIGDRAYEKCKHLFTNF